MVKQYIVLKKSFVNLKLKVSTPKSPKFFNTLEYFTKYNFYFKDFFIFSNLYTCIFQKLVAKLKLNLIIDPKLANDKTCKS